MGPNNYRMYHDPSQGRFVLIPWSMDLAMRARGSDEIIDPHAAVDLFLKRCMNAPRCRAAFDRTYAEEGARLSEVDMLTAARDAARRARRYYYADPRRERGIDRFENGIKEVYEFVETLYPPPDGLAQDP